MKNQHPRLVVMDWARRRSVSSFFCTVPGGCGGMNLFAMDHHHGPRLVHNQNPNRLSITIEGEIRNHLHFDCFLKLKKWPHHCLVFCSECCSALELWLLEPSRQHIVKRLELVAQAQLEQVPVLLDKNLILRKRNQ